MQIACTYRPEAAGLRTDYILSRVATATTTPNMEQAGKACTPPQTQPHSAHCSSSWVSEHFIKQRAQGHNQ